MLHRRKEYSFRTNKYIFLFIVYLCILVLRSEFIYSQEKSKTISFNSIEEIRTLKNPIGITVGDINGDGYDDIVSYNKKVISIHFQTDKAWDWRNVQFPIQSEIVFVQTELCNRDRLYDFIVLTNNPPQIEIYLSNLKERFYLQTTIPLLSTLINISTGDINSDGKLDILTFGKKYSGITIFLGRGNGTFHQPVTLFDDISFSLVKIDDINNDGIQDIIAIDWLANQILIYSGFRGLKFSEPRSFSFESEPMIITTGHIDSNETMDMLIGFLDERRILSYLGTGWGELTQHQDIDVEFIPTQIILADLNRDELDDMLVFDESGGSIALFVNDIEGNFDFCNIFTAGIEPKEFIIYHDYYSKYFNVAVLDLKTSKVRILVNELNSTPSSHKAIYPLGSLPQDVVIFDVDNDEWNDVLISSLNSNNISLLKNRGDGIFSGQVLLSTPIQPGKIVPFRNNDSTVSFIISNRDEKKISILNWILPNRIISNTLPGFQESQILTVSKKKEGDGLQIIVIDTSSEETRKYLTSYVEDSQLRFIEQTIRLNGDIFPLSAVVGDFNGDREIDAVILNYNRKLGVVELIQRNSIFSYESIPISLVTRFKEYESNSALMWTTDFNRDGIDDIMINLHEPANQLLSAIGRKNEPIKMPLPSINDHILITKEDRLKFIDLLDDKFNDVIFENFLNKSLYIYTGNGDGTFSNGMRLLSTEGIGGFNVGDMNKDGNPELILTESKNGILRIIPLE